MAGDFLNKVFTGVYTLLKINFLFLILSILGGIIFGIGPALYTIFQLWIANGWQFKKYKWAVAWEIYRKNFFKINRFAILHEFISILLLVNLYLAISIKGMLFFTISMLIVFVLILWSFVWFYYIYLTDTEDNNQKQILLLAVQMIFSSGKNLLTQLFGLIVLVIFMIKFPAFTFFWGFACVNIYVAHFLQKTIKIQNIKEV